jgi:uncharacterized membrane protein
LNAAYNGPVLILSMLIGVIAGLRTMMAPAAISWAATLGWLNLAPTSLAFFGYRFTPWVLTFLALGELIADQLPSTPSRTVPVQFGARIVSGGLCGAAVGAASGHLIAGAFAGVIGAVIGTLGGRALRGWMATIFRNDRPAAFIEDAIAIAGAWLIMAVAR